jgi:hypothetical protein
MEALLHRQKEEIAFPHHPTVGSHQEQLVMAVEQAILMEELVAHLRTMAQQ